MVTEARTRPLVSVIIPARNEQNSIAACLDSIERQSFEDFEILVVDGGSTDATVAVVEDFARDSRHDVRVLANPTRTIPHALNIGTREARGQIFVRMDAHGTMNDDYIAGCVDNLQSGEWAGVGGRKVAVGNSTVARAFGIAFGSRIGAGNSTYHYGAERTPVEHIPFGAYPKRVVESVGGWDEALPVNQDFEFDHRVRKSGGKLLFDPDLVVAWRSRGALGEIAYQYFRYGCGKVAVALKHPDSLRLRQVAPPVLVVGEVLCGVLWRRSMHRRWLLPLGAYAAIVTGSGSLAALRRQQPLRVAVTVPAVLTLMHHSWGLGFMAGLARRLVAGGRVADPFVGNPGER